MKLNIKTYNTLPSSKSHWWQLVILPTMTLMNNIQKHDPYVAFNIEWLFWSITTIISYGKENTLATRY
jgi:hypothetical protein